MHHIQLRRIFSYQHNMIVKILLLTCVLVTGEGEASPQIQLSDFDDLFALATGKITNQETMRDRGDRALTNTFPFNQVEQQRSHAQHQQSSYTQPKQSSYAQLQQRSYVQPKPTAQYSNFPASTTHLSQNNAAAGFTLLAGFGSRRNPWGQYQVGNPAQRQLGNPGQQQVKTPAQPIFGNSAHYQLGNPVVGGHKTATQEGVPVYAPSVSSSYAPAAPSFPPPSPKQPRYPAKQPHYPSQKSTGRGTSGVLQCPAAPGLPLNQCIGAVNSCWSVGVGDVDCPGHGLCCFDGCANTCVGQTRAVVREHIKVPHVNPAQKRRKTGHTISEVAAAGQKCVDKIEQIEEIEYDETEECNHTYDKKCHTSYSTEFESQQEEECEDNYKKSCQITYSPHATNVTVSVCMTPLVKDCNLPGPEVCRTEYISECWTKNDPHVVQDDVPRCETVYEEKCTETQTGYVTDTDCKKWPREVCTISKELRTKFNPVTKCEKVPQELCGPSGCGFSPGPEECHDEVKTVVTDLPEEDCDLQPQRKCSHVTKLVPKLTPVEECVDVPKEVCQKTKGNPRTVLKPVTKKWCYTPTEESGLH